jgi:long-chain acyl-CoA synthetase
MSLAEIHWAADGADRSALALRHDWSDLQGLEQLWPQLEARHGNDPALEAPHLNPPVTLSFRQLRQGIETAASGFASLGVGSGDVVALFAENGPRWLLADQGLMRAGAADAVRGSAAPVEELRYILSDSGAIALVVESAALLERLALDGPQRGRLRFVVVLEGEVPTGWSSAPSAEAGSAAGEGDASSSRKTPPSPPCLRWEQLLERGAAQAPPPWPEGGPQRLATLLYTSGTTGEPKGVPLSHANLLHQVRNLGVAVAPRAGDRVLSILPIWHAYERSAEYFLLACGACQTYTGLKYFRTDLQKVRPQYMISVPRIWEAIYAGFEDALAAMPASRRRLLELGLANSGRFHLCRRRARDLTLAPEGPGPRLAAAAEAALRWPLHGLAGALLWPKVRQQLVGGELRTAISGGGALPIHVDGFFEAVGIELLVGYGLTETAPVLTCRRPWANRRGSAGRPLEDTALKIVDPESRHTMALGERGLVLARGPQVMAGYFAKPEASAKAIDAEGWFDTGDLGLLMADGSLVLTGRAKDTIVLSSGENIEPGPLEEALAASPLVEQVMLVGQDRKQLAALLAPRAEPLQDWAATQGLSLPQGTQDDGASDPALLKALTRECNRVLAARPGSRPDERLAGVALVAPFTIENGLLTQTLKQRRDRITARDQAAIAALYGEA